MKKLYEKNELTFSLVWIVMYVVLFSIADSVSLDLGIAKIITVPICVFMTIFLAVWIAKNGLGEKYGLCKVRIDYRKYLYFLPLALIASTNLWRGVSLHFSVFETVLYVISMICVGFIEEVIFRGFLFTVIFYQSKSLAPCIVTHSLINSLSAVAGERTETLSIMTAIVLMVVSAAYAIWLLRNWAKCGEN